MFQKCTQRISQFKTGSLLAHFTLHKHMYLKYIFLSLCHSPPPLPLFLLLPPSLPISFVISRISRSFAINFAINGLSEFKFIQHTPRYDTLVPLSHLTKGCERIWYRLALGHGWNKNKWRFILVCFRASHTCVGSIKYGLFFISMDVVPIFCYFLYWVEWFLEFGSTRFDMKAMPRLQCFIYHTFNSYLIVTSLGPKKSWILVSIHLMFMLGSWVREFKLGL